MDSGTELPAGQPAASPGWKPYVLPFATLILLLAVGAHVGLRPPFAYPIRTLAVLAVLLVFSRGVIAFRPAQAIWSVVLGIAVFVIWILPDLLFPGYRHHWLFENALTGAASGSLPPAAVRGSLWYLCFRVGGAALLVPVVEELFWRAWFMRWLISPDIAKVPMGKYSAQAFWITAVLFASEHGVFWDVGLAAGILYNWWMIRTRSLADCILAHAVTNGCLAVYVLATGQWQYWL